MSNHFNLKLASKYSKYGTTDTYKEKKLHFFPLTSVPRSLLLCLPLSKPPQKNVAAKSFLQNLSKLLKIESCGLPEFDTSSTKYSSKPPSADRAVVQDKFPSEEHLTQS
jgi:hypothetical protein